jgi:hypothetical protein
MLADDRPRGFGRRLLIARALLVVAGLGLVVGVVISFLDARGSVPIGDIGFVAVFATFPIFGYILTSGVPRTRSAG